MCDHPSALRLRTRTRVKGTTPTASGILLSLQDISGVRPCPSTANTEASQEVFRNLNAQGSGLSCRDVQPSTFDLMKSGADDEEGDERVDSVETNIVKMIIAPSRNDASSTGPNKVLFLVYQPGYTLLSDTWRIINCQNGLKRTCLRWLAFALIMDLFGQHCTRASGLISER
jgi:hypothetical protein